jgi:hypothetical protein
MPPIHKCYGEGCTTLAFAVNGDDHPFVQHTIDYIIKVNNLSISDVQRWDTTLDETLELLRIMPNLTQTVVVFCTNGYWEIGEFRFPCFAEKYHLNTYTIIFNLTLFHKVPFFSNFKEAYPKDMTTVKLKKDIDEGIISYYNEQADLNISICNFPSKSSKLLMGLSIFGQGGSFFIMLPYLILMVMEGGQKLKQK